MCVFVNTVSDDLTIVQVNRTQEKPRVLCKMFHKLDVRHKFNHSSLRSDSYVAVNMTLLTSAGEHHAAVDMD